MKKLSTNAFSVGCPGSGHADAGSGTSKALHIDRATVLSSPIAMVDQPFGNLALGKIPSQELEAAGEHPHVEKGFNRYIYAVQHGEQLFPPHTGLQGSRWVEERISPGLPNADGLVRIMKSFLGVVKP